MKSMLSFIVSLLGLASFSFSLQLEMSDSEKWRLYKDEFSKSYTEEEDNERMITFYENLRKIEEHNVKYERGEVTYKLTINIFTDQRKEEIPKGYRPNGISFCEDEGEPWLGSYSRVPESIDWRSKGAVTPVKNQLFCGSCWAFSTTGALEGQHFLKTKQLVSLSEQDLVDCDKYDHGCEGGYPETGFKAITEQGIDTEDSYPYKAVDEPSCLFNKTHLGATAKGCRLVKAGDEEALKRAVATVGPISVIIDASSASFQGYTQGVFTTNDCSSKLEDADHAVLVVGYGTTNDGKDYWIVKNSWGAKWGDEGYILMARNHNNMCGIANQATYPVV